jgi:hypothetical protein
MLQKKEEGRALSQEDNTLLARFVDRVEKRGETDRRLEDEAAQAHLKAIRESIDSRAFELPIMDIPLKEHTLFILQEAGLETLGDLMMQVKLDSDAILAYNGIGPKSHEEILELVNSYQFPVVESAEMVEAVQAETALEAPANVEAEAGAPVTAIEFEVAAVEIIETAQAEAPVESDEEPGSVAQEVPSEEKSFEELFNMESLHRPKDDREVSVDEEDQGELKLGKKAKGKKKKGYTVEYDPDKDASIIRYKHKNEDEWEDW